MSLLLLSLPKFIEYCLIETVGENDKENIKLEFASDDLDWRGQLSNLRENVILETSKQTRNLPSVDYKKSS